MYKCLNTRRKYLYHKLCNREEEIEREKSIMCHNKDCVMLWWYRSIFVDLFKTLMNHI